MSAEPDDGGAPPGDRSWAARMAGFNQDRSTPWAINTAIFSLMAALGAWTVLFLHGGDIRFNPRFWLLAALPMVWIASLGGGARWAFNLIWVMLIAAPCLCVAALIVSPRLNVSAGVLEGDDLTLALPTALLVTLGISLVLSAIGIFALRRSSLPGGGRPVHFARPGSVPPGRASVPPAATGPLMLGSLTLTGTLINGILFGIVAILPIIMGNAGQDQASSLLLAGPVLLVPPIVLVSGFYQVRGRRRFAMRHFTQALDDLRRGWWIGIVCAPGFLVLLWVWPAVIDVKVGVSVFMLPLAIAAVWGGRHAMHRLPGIIARL